MYGSYQALLKIDVKQVDCSQKMHVKINFSFIL